MEKESQSRGQEKRGIVVLEVMFFWGLRSLARKSKIDATVAEEEKKEKREREREREREGG